MDGIVFCGYVLVSCLANAIIDGCPAKDWYVAMANVKQQVYEDMYCRCQFP